MPRFAIGVTLTPQERALQHRCGVSSAGPQSSRENTAVTLKSHTCPVTLSDQSSCPVSYTRYGACSHLFSYGKPVHQKVWFTHRLPGGAPGIEQKAQELCWLAVTMAMTTEQKAMRRKSIPKGRAAPQDRECLMRSQTADICGGKYAACLKFSSGRLMPVGRPHEGAEQAQADLYRKAEHTRLFPGQRLVIGICCRYLRMWIEPQFLPFPRPDIAAPPTIIPASTPAVAPPVSSTESAGEVGDEDKAIGE